VTTLLCDNITGFLHKIAFCQHSLILNICWNGERFATVATVYFTDSSIKT